MVWYHRGHEQVEWLQEQYRQNQSISSPCYSPSVCTGVQREKVVYMEIFRKSERQNRFIAQVDYHQGFCPPSPATLMLPSLHATMTAVVKP